MMCTLVKDDKQMDWKDWMDFNYDGWVKNNPLIHLLSIKKVLKNPIHP